MKPGDVVRWTFVQGDGQRKMRPAIIIGTVLPSMTGLFARSVHSYRAR